MTKKNHFIANEWVTGKGEVFSSVNPANNEVIWQGRNGLIEESEQAVQAARAAFPAWSALDYQQRLEYLVRFREVLEQHKQELTQAVAQEAGKPLWEAATEVGAIINKVDLSAQAYRERTFEATSKAGDATAFTRFRPHGVIVVLGPFNFPAYLPNGNIIPALLAGNTIVFKPSELTPSVAEKFMQYWQQANLPSGVLNMLQGGGGTGKALVENPNIDGVFFVGSFATGQKIHQHFAGKPEKIVALEMGGNNPLLIFDVQDKQAAAYLTIQSAYMTAGQRCTCVRRLIISNDYQGEELLATLIKMTSQIKVGKYTDTPEPFMGPVISAKAAERLLQAQQKLQTQGGKSLLEMQLLEPNTGLLSPGIIDVTDIKQRTDEEYFGPLLQVIRVNDFDAAIEEANNTAYGLSAGIIADDRSLYEKFYQQSQAGLVNWNRQLTGSSSMAPFGGTGHSGNHRPSAYYAADYCAYPVASLEIDRVKMPKQLMPGISL